MKWILFLTMALLVAGPLYMAAYGSDGDASGSWRTARRDSAGIAVLPADHPGAIIQVYAARTYSWRGHLAVHTWLASKEADADHYQTHYVMGFNARRGLPVVVSGRELPDRYWYGSKPELLLEIRGEKAQRLLPQLYEAVNSYPYADEYTLWPGPNSNTFTAWVGREVPELGMELPVTAIGKDYLPGGALVGTAPSGSGFQFSLFGALGLLIAQEEGVEVNVLGLVLGVDFNQPALKLPGIGRLGTPQLRIEPPPNKGEEGGEEDTAAPL